MVFLYIFECMLLFPFALVGGGTEALITTKALPTAVDMILGGIAWLTVIILVLGMALLIRYLKNKKLLNLKREMLKDKKVNVEKKSIYGSKKDKKIALFTFVIGLVVFIGGLIVIITVSVGVGRIVGMWMIFFGGATICIPTIIPVFRFLWNKFKVSSLDISEITNWQKNKKSP